MCCEAWRRCRARRVAGARRSDRCLPRRRQSSVGHKRVALPCMKPFLRSMKSSYVSLPKEGPAIRHSIGPAALLLRGDLACTCNLPSVADRSMKLLGRRKSFRYNFAMRARGNRRSYRIAASHGGIGGGTNYLRYDSAAENKLIMFEVGASPGHQVHRTPERSGVFLCPREAGTTAMGSRDRSFIPPAKRCRSRIDT